MRSSKEPGRFVADNVARVAEDARQLDQKSLVDRVQAQGTPMTATKLSNTKAGRRSMTVEELYAFARALNMSPTRLLALPHDRDDVQVQIGDYTASAAEVYRWCNHMGPLSDDEGADPDHDAEYDQYLTGTSDLRMLRRQWQIEVDNCRQALQRAENSLAVADEWERTAQHLAGQPSSAWPADSKHALRRRIEAIREERRRSDIDTSNRNR